MVQRGYCICIQQFFFVCEVYYSPVIVVNLASASSGMKYHRVYRKSVSVQNTLMNNTVWTGHRRANPSHRDFCPNPS